MQIEKLILEKEKRITTQEEQEKIKIIKDIVVFNDWMFKNDIEVVIGILEFLDVPEDKIQEYYISLISPENFSSKHPKERL